jgi:hypothetical protein
MSDSGERAKHSRRLHREQAVVNRQLKIAKQNGLAEKYIDQPHRLAKHHAMDCGNPGCPLCGNPRRQGEITVQERRLFQNLERKKSGNGIPPDSN